MQKKYLTVIAKVKCYHCCMLKTCKKNLVYLFKYSDTHLYEFGLCAMMFVLNPFHLMQLNECHTINQGSIFLLIGGSLVCGLCFGFGVALNSLNLRFQMARVYWAYTVFTLITLAPCGLSHEIGLVVSFVLQFFSSFFLLWRLGTERAHRLGREQGELK
jgi:lysylphosphatidylglycerol synthetase-like protein (DUF2156 family)